MPEGGGNRRVSVHLNVTQAILPVCACCKAQGSPLRPWIASKCRIVEKRQTRLCASRPYSFQRFHVISKFSDLFVCEFEVRHLDPNLDLLRIPPPRAQNFLRIGVYC